MLRGGCLPPLARAPPTHLSQVDCAALPGVCTADADVKAGYPTVHFYRGGQYVSKVFWGNPDLVRLHAEALLARSGGSGGGSGATVAVPPGSA